jgi:hypothetical protein
MKLTLEHITLTYLAGKTILNKFKMLTNCNLVLLSENFTANMI